MSFLIAEILVLLALAAVLGGCLVYWWTRRYFVDVSDEYDRYQQTMKDARTLRSENATAGAQIAALEAEKAQLDARLNSDIARHDALEAKVEALRTTVIGIPQADFSPVHGRLDAIHGVVAKLENTDVSGIVAGVAATSAAVGAIGSTDLTPLSRQLAAVDTRVSTLPEAVLTPVDRRLKDMDTSIRELEARLKPTPPTDLSGVHVRLDAIEKAVKAQPRSTSPLSTTSPRKERVATPRPKAGALLKSAAYGKADDLKNISGVGPKLERMLNGIGVYYFFQVEAWTKKDVEHVDDLLQVFKGRIERDQWVTQARGLARQPGAARMR